MYIKELKLINFRNYNHLNLLFHPKMNIFVGDNAQGKTNILEAIYLSSSAKSFRTSKDKELIQFGKDRSYIKIQGQKKYTDVIVELKLESKKSKQIKVNGVTLEKTSDLLDNVYVVVFSPEDLKLIKEGPVLRRKFMDHEISQMKPSYYHHLSQYQKILMQRNHLLKKMNYQKSIQDTLEVWDEKLCEIGCKLMEDRKKFIQRIHPLSRLIHRKITESKENLEIRYLSSIPMEKDIQKTKKLFLDKLKKNISIDLARGSTMLGPHRDDIGVFVNGIDIRSFGSQGQQRTSALSLKLAEIELIKGETGEYPILLLDDVMSELDINRQKFLIKSLKDIQIFITTTEIDHLKELCCSGEYVFYVRKARVSKG